MGASHFSGMQAVKSGPLHSKWRNATATNLKNEESPFGGLL